MSAEAGTSLVHAIGAVKLAADPEQRGRKAAAMAMRTSS
jgi:hypothetical protein